VNLIKELLSKSTANGSRTNALNHLQWMIAAFLAALLMASKYALAQSIIWLIAIVLCILILCYLGTHFYFMVKDPDALRSEKFTIQKMAIERGLVGDSIMGMREVTRGIASTNTLSDNSDEGQDR
jgi:hypothetical protein